MYRIICTQLIIRNIIDHVVVLTKIPWKSVCMKFATICYNLQVMYKSIYQEINRVVFAILFYMVLYPTFIYYWQFWHTTLLMHQGFSSVFPVKYSEKCINYYIQSLICIPLNQKYFPASKLLEWMIILCSFQ